MAPGAARDDLPGLAAAFAHIRTRRFADGPDEVHKNALVRNEIRRRATIREER